MRIKYIKWMLTLTMTAMGIGMTAFSFDQPGLELPAASAAEAQALESKAEEDSFGEIQKSGFELVVRDESETTAATVTTTVPVTEPEEPDPMDFPIELNTDSGIDNLIRAYMSAKLICDIDKFEGIVTDTQFVEVDKLQRKTEYIESYENIRNYIKPAKGDIDYIVYVYHELKITSIDTWAPALDELLIRYNEEGTPQIVLGEISDETSEYVALARQTEDVVELIQEVGGRLVAALEADEALAEFYSKLGAATNSSGK